MSSRDGQALVRRYFDDCVNRVGGSGRDEALTVVDEVMADDFLMAYNNDGEAEAMRGRDRHKEFLIEHARWYLDDRWTIEALVGNADVVACVWRIRARHARGSAVDVRAADFFTIRAGRLAELRRFLDFESLNAQTATPAGDA